MAEFDIPADLRYTAEHEWIKSLGDGVVRVGITSYAQDALGDIVHVTLPEVDSTITSGEYCGEVESTKSVSDLFAPVDGTVVAINAGLEDAPELINTDPYTDGWMFDVRVDDESVIDELMDADAYTASLD